QPAAAVGEHDPGRGGPGERDAAAGQPLEQVDDVEILAERVRQTDEGVAQLLFPAHVRLLLPSARPDPRLTHPRPIARGAKPPRGPARSDPSHRRTRGPAAAAAPPR